MATRKPARPGDLVESNADTRMIADLLRAPPVSAKELGLLDGIKANLGMATHFHRVDDAGHYCRVSAMAEWKELRMVYLLPKGAPRGNLVPVARDAIHDAMGVMTLVGTGPEAVEVPTYGDWKFWASFDGEELEDKGEALCRSWQTMLPGSEVALREEGFWEIYWPLATADALLQSLVLPGG